MNVVLTHAWDVLHEYWLCYKQTAMNAHLAYCDYIQNV